MTYPGSDTYPSLLTYPEIPSVEVPVREPPPAVPVYQFSLDPVPPVEYTYLFADLVSNEVRLEVPVFGVSYGRIMNKAGDGTLSINLDREGYSNEDVVGGTAPGKTAVYIDRNGSLIWGGIIWSRTYQSQAKVFSYTLQSFESYLYKIGIEQTLSYVNKDQRNILAELILYGEQKLHMGIGLGIDPNYPFGDSVLRTVDFHPYDQWSVGRAVEYMVEYEAGLDYTIDVFYDSFGNPAKRVRTDTVLGATVENTGFVLSYPGNIKNYYWSENASRSAVSVIGGGAGDGIEKVLTKYTNAPLWDLGYPDLQEMFSNSDVSVLNTLSSQTEAEAFRLAPPVINPTIEPGPMLEVGSFGLGDYANLEIEDPRFPGGLNSLVRVIGYDVTTDGSGAEELRLIIEGAEDA